MARAPDGRFIQRLRLTFGRNGIHMACSGCGALVVKADSTVPDAYELAHLKGCPDFTDDEDQFPGPLSWQDGS